jgi:uncharacterized protein involved in outer membrane biogenesis/outer membrane protein OmpA-like peptidoglycan-associated protein
MSLWKKALLIGVSLCLLTLIFITLILPGIINSRASLWVAENTGRALEIESISINPFNLSVTIKKLQLSETDQEKTFVSWDLLRVSLSAASLYHRAAVIDELHIEKPYVLLERQAAERFNFSDLIPEKTDEPEQTTVDEPARFSLNNLSINNGQIDLLDNSLDEAVQHTVRNLQLVLPAIGNLPYMVENSAQPLFQAEINDSEINLAGKVKPFSNVQEMQFNLEFDDIDLPFYLGYVPFELPVDVRSGKLSLNLDLLYRLSPESGGELELSGKINLASLNIHDRLQEQLFFLPLLQVEIAPSKPLKKDLHLSALRIYNLEVQLKRDLQGQWNHARMASTQTEAPVEEDAEELSNPFDLKIDAIEVRDGVLFFTDEMAIDGFSTVAREINIDVRDFTLAGEKSSPLELILKTDRSESASIKGLFSLSPFTMVLDTALKNIDTAAYVPYYEGVYSVPIEGKIDFRGDIASNPEQPFLLSRGQLKLNDAYMAFNAKEGVRVKDVNVSNISFDLDRNRLEIDSAEYSDSRINFSRTAEGHWTILSNNFPILAKLTETPEEQPVLEVTPEGPAFSYRIGTLTIKNLEIDINDELPTKATNLNASAINLVFNNLAAPEKVESPFSFSAVFQRKGQIEIKGRASLADQSVSMSSLLKHIPLASLSPYIEEQLNLVLTDGYLNTKLQTTITTDSETPQISFSGDIGISRFHLIDNLHQEDLLKWDSLQVAGIKGGLEPLTLGVESITLSDYFAKVLIDEKARLNLTEAFSKKGEPEESEEQKLESSPGEEPETTTPPVIKINTITLQGGHVDFTDRHLSRLFTADMRDLGGRIEGVSSEPEARAQVDLRGQLRSQSPLQISGVINPLAEKLFLDLKLNFHDIELSPMSPYSGNYAGYLIEKGKLNLALEYYLEDNQLKAKNKVFLDQFSFGDEIESEKATGLPVKLAVALLKDRNGEIHLDIPVSGSLEDPQFSIGGVIWTVIKNLLVKVATSPFALLGAMFGDSDEDFSHISFAYGSSSLSSTETEKLQRMAQALTDRPGIDIEVSGFVDLENDEEGYRREQLNRQVRRLKYLDLVKDDQLDEGRTEDNVVVPVEEYDEYLWQVYRKSDFPKPRNFIGMTKKIPPAEMEKLIYTHTEVTPDDLTELAQARALAVQGYLLDEGQLQPERIFLKKPDITTAPEEETTYRARVELGAAVR